MEFNQSPLFFQQNNPTIQGDPATSKFALVFLIVLAISTIGVGVGIGVGNISHYRYFGPHEITARFSPKTLLVENLTKQTLETLSETK